MRMYLSSFRLGDHPERLVALLADATGPAAIILNACDGYPAEGRAEGVQREIDALRGLGVEAHVIDLRDYFGQPERLAGELRHYGMVWVRGGSAFVLRYAMAASGADTLLTDLIRRGAIVYAGYSAGACVLAPSLRGLQMGRARRPEPGRKRLRRPRTDMGRPGPTRLPDPAALRIARPSRDRSRRQDGRAVPSRRTAASDTARWAGDPQRRRAHGGYVSDE